MIKYCSNYPHKGVEVELIKNPCRYHKYESQEYCGKKLAPFKFCFDAFYVAYSYCFALLYGAKFEFGNSDSVKIRCPAIKNFIIMEIRKKRIFPKFVIALKEKLIKFLQRLNIPCEFPHQKIKIRVMENNNCPAGYRLGEEFEFNIWKKDELCPAGFNALFPFISNDNKGKVHCPDPRGIIYNTQ